MSIWGFGKGAAIVSLQSLCYDNISQQLISHQLSGVVPDDFEQPGVEIRVSIKDMGDINAGLPVYGNIMSLETV